MMWRYLVGALAALLLAGAGMMLFRGKATQPLLPAMPVATAEEPAETPGTVPAATARTREEKRFGRYDKDKDGNITRAEYLLARQKAYAKLDTNGDGRLSFDEWAIKATTKFATADRDKSGAMNASEFATTAVKRKPPVKAKCVCPTVTPPEEE